MLKCFEQTTSHRDLDSRLVQGELYNNCQEPYNKLTQIFYEVLDYYAPVKQKVVRGNQALFMTKDVSKAIMMKLKAKNQYVIIILWVSVQKGERFDFSHSVWCVYPTLSAC